MKAPEIPICENARLGSLNSLHILDTPPEERFDRLTRIASSLFQVPIALVSLVDRDRQWFKSAVGLEAKETSRDISFCGHTILDRDILIVNDALNDERFADNPLVCDEPKIRFYAGCPLTTTSGHTIGTLCLIDRHPRAFSDLEQIILRDLAAMVEREIELTQMATRDELTGVLNRRGFRTLASQALNLCERKGLPASLIYFDVDKFKQINDTHGHAAGDNVLSLVAETMIKASREYDLISRIGGDEFVILLMDTKKTAAQLILERFDMLLKQRVETSRVPYQVTLSCGIVEFDPVEHKSIEALLTAADAQMYSQKHAKTVK